MNFLKTYPMSEIYSIHSKTSKTIGFTMVLEPFRVRETRKLKNQRTLEENPKRILTRVIVHVLYKNDDVFHTFLKIVVFS